MKLKLDDQGHAVVQDGKPVYVYDDGKEAAFDAPAAVTKIKTLSDDRDGWRTKATEAETKVKELGEDFDVTAAKEALATVASLKDSKKAEADRIKEIQQAADRTLQEQLAKRDEDHKKVVDGLRGEVYDLRVGQQFSASKFLKDETVYTPQKAKKVWGDSFKVEEGAVVGYFNGKPIYSREKPGEYAGFEEALRYMIENDSERDSILRSQAGGGSGAHSSTAQTTNADVSKLPPTDRLAAAWGATPGK